MQIHDVLIDVVLPEDECSTTKGGIIFLWKGLRIQGMYCGDQFSSGEHCSLDLFFDWDRIELANGDVDGIRNSDRNYAVVITGRVASERPFVVSVGSVAIEIDELVPDEYDLGQMVSVYCFRVDVLRIPSLS